MDEAGEPVSVSHKCVGGEPGVDGAPSTPGTWGEQFYNGDDTLTTSPINGDPTINPPSGVTDCSADVRLCTVCDESKTICQQKRDVKGFKASVATIKNKEIKLFRFSFFGFPVSPLLRF